jgi:predicted dehydrogenase
MRVLIVLLIALFFNSPKASSQANDKPVRLALAGLTHGHAAFILNGHKKGIELVAIYEPDKNLSERLAREYHLDAGLFYNDLEKMLDIVKPEAVAAFGSIYEHMMVVEACAPRGIHVMVEKPLAVSNEHAAKMAELASKYHIFLLTDFETSWYPTTQKTWDLVHDSSYVGKMRKVVIHDGHQGPKEIGVSDEFFKWLTDPVQNGGGALMDFGCYGANLMTYLMQGEMPVSVTAVTRQYKPEIYPWVDDDATIIVNYPSAQCVIQASWNWPFGRKDMEVYGDKGYIISMDANRMRLRNNATGQELNRTVNASETGVYTEPFAYFADVVRGKVKMPEFGTYTLQNNIIAVHILEAARESAKTGKTVMLEIK